MLTFLQFILEMWKPERAMKGWMSPSGKAHMFNHYDEHRLNHHPEYLAKGGKQGDHIQDAQAHGFVRFGGNANSFHGFHHFVHYDSNHPEGKKTALKALHYMRPEHDDDVTVSGTPGLFKKSKKTGKMYRISRAMRELGHESIMPARDAFRKLNEPDKPKRKLHEGVEETFGRKIKAASTGDNDSYKILDSHPHTKGSTWQAGGCGVLAHALHKHLPGSKLVDVHNKKTGHTEHVAVHHGEHIYDADGATPAKHFLKKFAKREMKNHDDLELTPHDPARAKKSGISTHPGQIDKMHAHLKATFT